MQKLQILFPDPVMAVLRRTAEAEDRPVSEIVRRAVERHLAQLPATANGGLAVPPTFPTFSAGKILADAARMKEILYEDDGL
jgi:Ribbon-helix-helix protein, copG family